jgi:hypothetical protein
MDERGTLGQVARRGDAIEICCRRSHVGLKSSDTCRTNLRLDIDTLVALHGPERPIDALERELHCPGCGTRQIVLQIVRRRRIIRSRVNLATLGQAPERVFAFTCVTCPRRGRYGKPTLMRLVGADAMIKGLPVQVAAKRGCPLAIGADASLACGARYDVVAMYRILDDPPGG